MTEEAISDAFRLIQSGQVVARTEGPHAHALREIMHYANVYRQDGPLLIERRDGKRWRMYGYSAAEAG